MIFGDIKTRGTRHVSLLLQTLLVMGCAEDFDSEALQTDVCRDFDIVCTTGCDATKSQIMEDGEHIWWSPSDSITLLKVKEGSGKLVSSNTEPAASAVFSGTVQLSSGGNKQTPYYGIYPYRADCCYDDGAVSSVVPEAQSAVAGSYDPVSFPSVAVSMDGGSLNFKNICGGVRFKVVNSGVTSVEFAGNSSETVTGKVEVKFDEDEKPYVSKILEAGKKATLTCRDGFTPGKWYYISLLPVTLEKGFTVTLSNGSSTVQYVSDRKTQVKRSVFGMLSKLDDGLSFEPDWKQNSFVHKSLLLSIPNRSFSSVFVSTPEGTINSALTQTQGNLEVAQMFANGDGTTEGVGSVLSLFNISTVPFFITDYRQSGESVIESTYRTTPELYGTVSGAAISSYYYGNVLNIDLSLYFKEAGKYKAVVLVTEEDTSYSFSYQSGKYSSTTAADYLTRYVPSSISGDDVTVTDAPDIKYRSYKVTVTDAQKAGKLRVLVYILRPYGSREVVSNGSYGSDYVDNAYSARAGTDCALPVQVSIDSEISDFQNGGNIEM